MAVSLVARPDEAPKSPEPAAKPARKRNRRAEYERRGPDFAVHFRKTEKRAIITAKKEYAAEHGLGRLSNSDFFRLVALTPSVEIQDAEDIILFEQLRSELSTGIARLTKAATLHKILQWIAIARDGHDGEDARYSDTRAEALRELLSFIPDDLLHAEVDRRVTRIMTPGASEVHAALLKIEEANRAAAADPDGNHEQTRALQAEARRAAKRLTRRGKDAPKIIQTRAEPKPRRRPSTLPLTPNLKG